jgi:hypothetical protein
VDVQADLDHGPAARCRRRAGGGLAGRRAGSRRGCYSSL